MTWSTRQLAQLADTTVKTVRHYHELGLLEEPQRALNGYKQYEVAHLIRLLQIRRLTEIGLPLSQIATMDGASEVPDEAIRAVDSELAATIERLERVRAELAVILRHRAPVDVPSGFESVAGSLTATDRAMLLISSQLLDQRAMSQLKELVQQDRDQVDDELEALPPDAAEAVIQDLAERMAGPLAVARASYPSVANAGDYSTKDSVLTVTAVVQALAHLYNPAQLEVLRRADLLANARAEQGPNADAGSAT